MRPASLDAQRLAMRFAIHTPESRGWAAFASVLLLALAALLLSRDARADASGAVGDRGCGPERRFGFAPRGLWNDDTLPWGDKLGRTLLYRSDYANAGLYTAGLLGVTLGADPPNDARWTNSAGFEDDARDAFVAGSKSGRERADTISDALLYVTASAPIWLDVAAGSVFVNRDCDSAKEILGETLEAVSLTALITETTKLIAGRERPYERECASDPTYDSDCFSRGSRMSWFSGHASLTAAGAGILCRNTYFRETPVWGMWGSIRNPAPCAAGVAASIAAGFLRMTADQHWLTDVLVGWGVGITIGLFDLPGPFDLLKFRYGSEAQPVEGFITPSVGNGSAGMRLVMRF